MQRYTHFETVCFANRYFIFVQYQAAVYFSKWKPTNEEAHFWCEPHYNPNTCFVYSMSNSSTVKINAKPPVNVCTCLKTLFHNAIESHWIDSQIFLKMRSFFEPLPIKQHRGIGEKDHHYLISIMEDELKYFLLQWHNR